MRTSSHLLSFTAAALLLAATAPALAGEEKPKTDAATSSAASSASRTATKPAPAPAKPADPAAPAPEASKVDLSPARVSYSMGVNMAKNFKAQEIEVDIDGLVKGLRDGLAGTSEMTDEEMQAVMMGFQQQMRNKAMEKRKVVMEKNKAAGDAFLASNKTKKGVTTTASGLQYEVLTAGTGPIPKPEESVSVHYHGTLIDGTVFDSSIDRGQPVSFPVRGVIPGWTEALQLMKVGSKWRIYVPAELAYGDRGAGPKIEPNSTLIFDVELLGIEEPKAPAAAAPAPAAAEPQKQ